MSAVVKVYKESAELVSMTRPHRRVSLYIKESNERS